MGELNLRASTSTSAGYQVFMLALCVFALGLLAFEASEPQPATRVVLDYADLAVCMVFLVDFVINLVRAENRVKYFVTWGWIDLLSSIPAIDVARWGRFARIFRIFRLLRGVRATHIVFELLMKQRAKNTILAAALMALMLVTFCSIAILNVEAVEAANIKSAEDAVWWSLVTIATVGYGDRYPVTTEGRMIAVVLMSGGVALYGVFSGFLASWFVGEEDTNAELVAVREELARLRQMLEQQQR